MFQPSRSSLFVLLVAALAMGAWIPAKAGDHGYALGFEAGDLGVENFVFIEGEQNEGSVYRLDFETGRIEVGSQLIVTGGLFAEMEDGSVFSRSTIRFGFRDIHGEDYLEIAFPQSAPGTASYAALILFPIENIQAPPSGLATSGESFILEFDPEVGINNPALEYSEIRFVIRTGDTYAVSSEEFSAGRGTFIELLDPASAQWITCSFQEGLLSEVAGEKVTGRDLNNIEAAGFLIQLRGADTLNDPLYRFQRFKAPLTAASNETKRK